MRKLSMKVIKDSIRNDGIRYTLYRGIDYISHKFFSEEERIYKYIKKYQSAMKSDSYKRIVISEKTKNNTIWVCWLQGMEDAPKIIKCCYESLLRYNSDKEIIVITEDNMLNYVSLPEYIISKYKNGIITRAHLSDILRTALIYQRGGLWVDSTMFFTEKIPEFVWNEDIFLFTFLDKNIRQIASSQFIYAKAGNEILGRTLYGLYTYWKKEKNLVSYYLWHFMFSVAVESGEKTKDSWSKIPKMYAECNHVLQMCLFSDFSEVIWDYIKRVSFVHKLTYKNMKKEKLNKKNTFYKKVIQG